MLSEQGPSGVRSARRRQPVALIEKSDFCNTSLSIAAKGLLAVYACFEGDAEDIELADLARICRETEEQLLPLLGELEAAAFVATGDAAEAAAAEAKQMRAAERLAWEVGADRRRAREIHPDSVVYYLRRSDGAVKIGFSVELKKRMLVLSETHGELELLATEPGGLGKERERHTQFDRFRIQRNREWFRAEVALLRHIRQLAGQNVA